MKLANGTRFKSEMTKHRLTLLEALCISTYTFDARIVHGYTREDSPFFM
jgi:hypothetical protein